MHALTEHALRNSVASQTFETVYYFYGDDDFRKEEAVAHLITSAVPLTVRDFNFEMRRASDLDAAAVASLLDTPPMMADRRAVVIRDVGALKKDARRLLDHYLRSPAPNSVVVLTTPAGTKADPALLAQAVAVDFPALTGDRVPKWIAYRAKELDATITDDASALLFEAVGSDLAALAGELDKLVSYVRGTAEASSPSSRVVIDEGAVSAVVGVRRGETLADLLDRVAARDAAGALAILPHVMALPKTTAVSIVMALTTQTLALAWGVARRAQGVSVARLPNEYFGLLRDAGGGAMTGRPWGQAVTAWANVIDAWSPSELDRALDALLAADVALKDTRVSSDEQLLTSLILTLCQAPPRARGSRGKRMAAAMVAVMLAFAASVPVRAQAATSHPVAVDSATVDSVIQRVEDLVGNGNTGAGRVLIDSLLNAMPSGTSQYANALYARASLAESADEAERDYRELTVDYPESPRATLALLRLAQLETARGQHGAAVAHLTRLTHEFVATRPSDAATEYEIGKAFLELNDPTHACSAFTTAQSIMAPGDVEMGTRVTYAMQQCARTAPALASSTPASSPPPPKSTPQAPAKSEPAKPEPAKSEPAKSEPAKSEPAKSEPVKSEPVKSEPAKSEPAKSEPPAPVKSEPPTPTPATPEPQPPPPPPSVPTAPATSQEPAKQPATAPAATTPTAPATTSGATPSSVPPASTMAGPPASSTSASTTSGSPPPESTPPPLRTATKPTPVPPVEHPAQKYTVQVGAYQVKSEASELATKLLAKGDSARVTGTAAPFRVRIGRYATWAQAEAKRKALTARHIEAFVTEAEPEPEGEHH